MDSNTYTWHSIFYIYQQIDNYFVHVIIDVFILLMRCHIVNSQFTGEG